MPEEVIQAPAPEEPKLSRFDIARAATNDPNLSDEQFVLGDRTFKIVDLSYDGYLEFMALLQPMMDGIVGVFTKTNVNLPGISLPKVTEALNPSKILKFCAKELPEMAAVVCRGTDKSITADWIKQQKPTPTPFRLAAIVLKQVTRNNVLADFMDFFVQTLPVLKKMGLNIGEKK